MNKQIGNYTVVAELGRGGMGVVYKAREESLQRFVAIKMLGNQLVDNESVALRFMREARAVADLNHPNLVQVFRVDRHEDQPYFVMEYVEGESLKHLIQRERKMQPLRALQILKEVAAGLAAAHAKGVIHRDIKPENIMLTRYGGVKVVDFGIARVDEPGTRLTTTGIGLGTPSYLSPEVCLSQDVDQRSDIFSLGVVLFEMLTGDTPFKSDSPFELMTKVVE
ncbi:MAG: serine/threonine-protein kinase, partial [Wenzhouxiangellaceae bacterium]